MLLLNIMQLANMLAELASFRARGTFFSEGRLPRKYERFLQNRWAKLKWSFVFCLLAFKGISHCPPRNALLFFFFFSRGRTRKWRSPFGISRPEPLGCQDADEPLAAHPRRHRGLWKTLSRIFLSAIYGTWNSGGLDVVL